MLMVPYEHCINISVCYIHVQDIELNGRHDQDTQVKEEAKPVPGRVHAVMWQAWLPKAHTVGGLKCRVAGI